MDSKEIEKSLIKGAFKTVSDLNQGNSVPSKPGIYCIKLRKGVIFPKDYDEIREDGIIYIGIASKSLKERLWDQELNHKKAATFFRSIGAMLEYLPNRGSLAGKKTTNYKFNYKDTEEIRNWMRQSLLVNYVSLEFSNKKIEEIEKSLIKKYSPLINIKHNDHKSQKLKEARQKCLDWAKTQ